MANNICPKCGVNEREPGRSYCKACGNAWQNEYKQKHPQQLNEAQKARIRETARLRRAAMTPEERQAYLEKRQAQQRAWIANNPDVRKRRNEQAQKCRDKWGPERLQQQKDTQRAHYQKRQLRPDANLCAYSVSCSEPPIGEQKFCLLHWCRGLTQADLRQKAQFTEQELVSKWIAQKGLCAITGVALIPGKTAALDHIDPVGNGGPSTIENIRFVHRSINRFKWNMNESEFAQAAVLLGEKLFKWGLDNLKIQ